MEKLTKDDLAQMNRGYFENLAPETLIDVACRLRDFCVDSVERLEQNSKNSSRLFPFFGGWGGECFI